MNNNSIRQTQKLSQPLLPQGPPSPITQTAVATNQLAQKTFKKMVNDRLNDDPNKHGMLSRFLSGALSVFQTPTYDLYKYCTSTPYEREIYRTLGEFKDTKELTPDEKRIVHYAHHMHKANTLLIDYMNKKATSKQTLFSEFWGFGHAKLNNYNEAEFMAALDHVIPILIEDLKNQYEQELKDEHAGESNYSQETLKRDLQSKLDQNLQQDLINILVPHRSDIGEIESGMIPSPFTGGKSLICAAHKVAMKHPHLNEDNFSREFRNEIKLKIESNINKVNNKNSQIQKEVEKKLSYTCLFDQDQFNEFYQEIGNVDTLTSEAIASHIAEQFLDQQANEFESLIIQRATLRTPVEDTKTANNAINLKEESEFDDNDDSSTTSIVLNHSTSNPSEIPQDKINEIIQDRTKNRLRFSLTQTSVEDVKASFDREMKSFHENPSIDRYIDLLKDALETVTPQMAMALEKKGLSPDPRDLAHELRSMIHADKSYQYFQKSTQGSVLHKDIERAISDACHRQSAIELAVMVSDMHGVYNGTLSAEGVEPNSSLFSFCDKQQVFNDCVTRIFQDKTSTTDKELKKHLPEVVQYAIFLQKSLGVTDRDHMIREVTTMIQANPEYAQYNKFDMGKAITKLVDSPPKSQINLQSIQDRLYRLQLPLPVIEDIIRQNLQGSGITNTHASLRGQKAATKEEIKGLMSRLVITPDISINTAGYSYHKLGLVNDRFQQRLNKVKAIQTKIASNDPLTPREAIDFEYDLLACRNSFEENSEPWTVLTYLLLRYTDKLNTMLNETSETHHYGRLHDEYQKAHEAGLAALKNAKGNAFDIDNSKYFPELNRLTIDQFTIDGAEDFKQALEQKYYDASQHCNAIKQYFNKNNRFQQGMREDYIENALIADDLKTNNSAEYNEELISKPSNKIRQAYKPYQIEPVQQQFYTYQTTSSTQSLVLEFLNNNVPKNKANCDEFVNRLKDVDGYASSQIAVRILKVTDEATLIKRFCEVCHILESLDKKPLTEVKTIYDKACVDYNRVKNGTTPFEKYQASFYKEQISQVLDHLLTFHELDPESYHDQFQQARDALPDVKDRNKNLLTSGYVDCACQFITRHPPLFQESWIDQRNRAIELIEQGGDTLLVELKTIPRLAYVLSTVQTLDTESWKEIVQTLHLPVVDSMGLTEDDLNELTTELSTKLQQLNEELINVEEEDEAISQSEQLIIENKVFEIKEVLDSIELMNIQNQLSNQIEIVNLNDDEGNHSPISTRVEELDEVDPFSSIDIKSVHDENITVKNNAQQTYDQCINKLQLVQRVDTNFIKRVLLLNYLQNNKSDFESMQLDIDVRSDSEQLYAKIIEYCTEHSIDYGKSIENAVTIHDLSKKCYSIDDFVSEIQKLPQVKKNSLGFNNDTEITRDSVRELLNKNLIPIAKIRYEGMNSAEVQCNEQFGIWNRIESNPASNLEEQMNEKIAFQILSETADILMTQHPYLFTEDLLASFNGFKNNSDYANLFKLLLNRDVNPFVFYKKLEEICNFYNGTSNTIPDTTTLSLPIALQYQSMSDNQLTEQAQETRILPLLALTRIPRDGNLSESFRKHCDTIRSLSNLSKGLNTSNIEEFLKRLEEYNSQRINTTREHRMVGDLIAIIKGEKDAKSLTSEASRLPFDLNTVVNVITENHLYVPSDQKIKTDFSTLQNALSDPSTITNWNEFKVMLLRLCNPPNSDIPRSISELAKDVYIKIQSNCKLLIEKSTNPSKQNQELVHEITVYLNQNANRPNLSDSLGNQINDIGEKYIEDNWASLSFPEKRDRCLEATKILFELLGGNRNRLVDFKKILAVDTAAGTGIDEIINAWSTNTSQANTNALVKSLASIYSNELKSILISTEIIDQNVFALLNVFQIYAFSQEVIKNRLKLEPSDIMQYDFSSIETQDTVANDFIKKFNTWNRENLKPSTVDHVDYIDPEYEVNEDDEPFEIQQDKLNSILNLTDESQQYQYFQAFQNTLSQKQNKSEKEGLFLQICNTMKGKLNTKNSNQENIDSGISSFNVNKEIDEGFLFDHIKILCENDELDLVKSIYESCGKIEKYKEEFRLSLIDKDKDKDKPVDDIISDLSNELQEIFSLDKNAITDHSDMENYLKIHLSILTKNELLSLYNKQFPELIIPCDESIDVLNYLDEVVKLSNPSQAVLLLLTKIQSILQSQNIQKFEELKFKIDNVLNSHRTTRINPEQSNQDIDVIVSAFNKKYLEAQQDMNTSQTSMSTNEVNNPHPIDESNQSEQTIEITIDTPSPIDPAALSIIWNENSDVLDYLNQVVVVENKSQIDISLLRKIQPLLSNIDDDNFVELKNRINTTLESSADFTETEQETSSEEVNAIVSAFQALLNSKQSTLNLTELSLVNLNENSKKPSNSNENNSSTDTLDSFIKPLSNTTNIKEIIENSETSTKSDSETFLDLFNLTCITPEATLTFLCGRIRNATIDNFDQNNPEHLIFEYFRKHLQKIVNGATDNTENQRLEKSKIQQQIHIIQEKIRTKDLNVTNFLQIEQQKQIIDAISKDHLWKFFVNQKNTMVPEDISGSSVPNYDQPTQITRLNPIPKSSSKNQVQKELETLILQELSDESTSSSIDENTESEMIFSSENQIQSPLKNSVKHLIEPVTNLLQIAWNNYELNSNLSIQEHREALSRAKVILLNIKKEKPEKFTSDTIINKFHSALCKLLSPINFEKNKLFKKALAKACQTGIDDLRRIGHIHSKIDDDILTRGRFQNKQNVSKKDTQNQISKDLKAKRKFSAIYTLARVLLNDLSVTTKDETWGNIYTLETELKKIAQQ